MKNLIRMLIPALALSSLVVGQGALAKLERFHVSHVSGPCSTPQFRNTLHPWPQSQNRPIPMATGETISVRLYGHGADFAQDAVGANIYEGISARGTTTDFPATGGFPMGWVDVNVHAAPDSGVGIRRITVKWWNGSERFWVQVMPNCNGLTSHDYRFMPPPPPPPPTPGYQPGGGVGGGGGTSTTGPAFPNLLPTNMLSLPVRALSGIIPTPSGGMVQINPALCAGLAPNVSAAVTMPELQWGVTAVRPELANTVFSVRLEDYSDPFQPRLLDTLTLSQGIPSGETTVLKRNYAGRPATISVVRNPVYAVGGVMQEQIGCFTKPAATVPSLDPRSLRIVVDPNSQINEGDKEGDNELAF